HLFPGACFAVDEVDDLAGEVLDTAAQPRVGACRAGEVTERAEELAAQVVDGSRVERLFAVAVGRQRVFEVGDPLEHLLERRRVARVREQRLHDVARGGKSHGPRWITWMSAKWQ